jgi:hypothetical protein
MNYETITAGMLREKIAFSLSLMIFFLASAGGNDDERKNSEAKNHNKPEKKGGSFIKTLNFFGFSSAST